MEANNGKVCNDLVGLFSLDNGVRGMQILDRDAFRKIIKLPGLRIEAKHCSVFRKKFQKYLLNIRQFKSIVADSDPNNRTKRVILLDPEKPLSQEDREFIESHSAEEIIHDLVIEYEFWSSEQVLREVLPLDITEVPSGFETVGHVAHVNLRDKQLKFKNVIGQVILDKNSPQIKTVVNKTNTIDDTFRFFKMEVIAGENNLQTTVIQDGCTYKFDFSNVYWNSRLQTEHKRLVDNFGSDEVICDMFAGVGPFAIPAAKNGCLVYANDLNPNSYEALMKNAKCNQVKDTIICYNMDGREFMKLIVKKAFNVENNKNDKMFDHVVMNLPASAVQFLDVFKGLLTVYKDRFVSSDCGKPMLSLPTIHCYCFTKAENPEEDAQKQAEDVLGVSLGESCKVHNVRNVAPKKHMMCVTFKLPETVAFGTSPENDTYGSTTTKRCRDDDEKEPLPKQAKTEEPSSDS